MLWASSCTSRILQSSTYKHFYSINFTCLYHFCVPPSFHSQLMFILMKWMNDCSHGEKYGQLYIYIYIYYRIRNYNQITFCKNCVCFFLCRFRYKNRLAPKQSCFNSNIWNEISYLIISLILIDFQAPPEKSNRTKVRVTNSYWKRQQYA